MMEIIAESPYALLVAGVVVLGLWSSNLAYDRNVPHYVSRKVGHLAGGLAFTIGVLLFSSAWWPIILSALFGMVLFAARVLRPQTFRGVGGSARRGSLAEVWFALVAVPVFAVAWLWLQRPFLALACLLFMAWGDCATGIIRARIYHRPIKGLWGSAGMFLICLAIALILLKPWWIGMSGAFVATVTEWSFGEYGLLKWADDNWAVPLSSLGVMADIMALSGNL
jgi:phytol kinase